MKAKLNVLKLALKSRSPEILLGVGMSAVIIGGVIACKNTPRFKEKIEEIDGAMLCTDDKKEEKALKIEMVKETTKAYALPVFLTIGGFVLIISGHNILSTRNVVLATGCKSLMTAYNAYDKNVREKYGDDIADKLKYGIKKAEKIEEDKNGKEKTVKYDTIDRRDLQSPFVVFFDESSAFWKDNVASNMDFLRKHERWLNDRLQAEGHLYVNDILKELDIPTKPIGQLYGWRKDKVNGVSDGYIDFRLVNYWNKRAVNGMEPVILLDLNVDAEPLVKNENLFTKSR